MRLEEAQHTAKTRITRTLGPLPRLLCALRAAAVYLMAPAAAPAQQPARRARELRSRRGRSRAETIQSAPSASTCRIMMAVLNPDS